MNSVFLGKSEVVSSVFAALLAGGHVLLEDVPGVGKTLLVRAIARVMGGDFRRISLVGMLPADVARIDMGWQTGRACFPPRTADGECGAS